MSGDDATLFSSANSRKSELRNTINSGMYFATGNNLVILGDMGRRAMRCHD